jgi:hypothetical protein
MRRQPGPRAALRRTPAELETRDRDQLLRASGFAGRGRSRRRGTPFILHTSHLRLDRPEHFAWLGRRPDIRAVFFVHDLIPIDFPNTSFRARTLGT